MWVRPVCRGAFLGFSVALLLVIGFCYCDDKTIEVIGIGECTDCKEKDIQSSHIFSGMQVSIGCKDSDGKFKIRGIGKLDEEGKFKITLPKEMVKDDDRELMEDCFAKLHSTSNVHCPSGTVSATHINAQDADANAISKIILIKLVEEDNKENNRKHYTFGTAGKLAFSQLTCTSSSSTTSSSSSSSLKHYLKFLFPKDKYPLHKPLPKFKIPPKFFPPIHKKPLPFIKKKPHIPPVYKKPLIPPFYKKPLIPPFYKKPPFPPVYKKPLLPPIYKKPPCPPFYKKPLLPPIYKKKPFLPPIPKIPPPVLKKKLIHHDLP